MEQGRVRAILGRHALAGPGHAWSTSDPNQLLDSTAVDAALRSAGADDARLRALGRDYASLWSRTFRNLVRQLRGRPERALSLFASEVYPFLRGDRLAARIETSAAGRAQVSLSGGLPPPYLAGLVEGFVGLSGAVAHAEPTVAPAGFVTLRVQWTLGPADRLARAVQQASLLRLPLLACAFVAALLGVALGQALHGGIAPWRVGAVLAGAVLVQVGSNAWHDLHVRRPGGTLGSNRLARPALWRLVWLGYLPATLLGLALAWNNAVVLLFAGAGVVVSILFARFRSQGWGPLLAGLTYGPLIAEGALHAVAPGAGDHVSHLLAVLWTLPLGATAAALLYLDDLADRPLDEAGGARTLLVRLPQAGHWLGLALLLIPGTGILVALAAASHSTALLGASLLALLGAAALLARVRRHLDDPRALAPDRVAMLVLHLAVAALSVLSLLQLVPA